MSGPYLLDVNVLVALMWPAHAFHVVAEKWAATRARSGWATCPITESGFVRIVSNPSFSVDALTPEQAKNVLADTVKDAGAKFWPDAISYVEAITLPDANVIGHQQTTDAYLLGLAIHNGGKLATFDRRIATLLPPSSPHVKAIEIVGG